MSQKRILILNGHPGDSSLSRLFAERYANAARQSGADVRVHHLPDLQFDMDFGQGGYADFKPLEPSLETFMNDLEWAEHFVLTTPMWWGGLPAKLKGLFDRAFVPGLAFNTQVKNRIGMPTPMLTRKTARVVVTSDTPLWFERLIYKRAIIHQIGKQILGFVGIKPTRFTWFSGASEANEVQTNVWAQTVARLGHRMV